MDYPGEKLLNKMWESLVDRGIGGLLKPLEIRREGKANTDVEIDRMLRLAQAEQTAEEIRKGNLSVEGNSKIKLTDNTNPKLKDVTHSNAVKDLFIDSIKTNFSDSLRKEINVTKAILEAEKEIKKIHKNQMISRLMIAGFTGGEITQAKLQKKKFRPYGAKF